MRKSGFISPFLLVGEGKDTGWKKSEEEEDDDGGERWKEQKGNITTRNIKV